MDTDTKKKSFVLYPEAFLSSVHHFKKCQIADLIIALCEQNCFGDVTIKLSDVVKKRFTNLQRIIDTNNAKYLEICEKRQANGSKGGSKSKAKSKQTESKTQANTFTPPPSESEKEKENESDNEYENGCKEREPETVDKQRFPGAPTVEEVAEYAKMHGYPIDPVAFVRWHNERGWMNGKKYIALDWQKAVRKWFCKDNGISISELECAVNYEQNELSKGLEVQNVR